MNLVKVISTELDDISRRIVKFLRKGKGDVQTAPECAPYGIDSNPVKDMIAVYGQTGVKGKQVVLGYINKNQLAAVGENRIYSTDSEGTLSFAIHLKADGTCEIGGTADNLVRFANTKAVIDEIQSDIASIKQVFSTWVPVPMDGGAALKTAATTWAATPLTEDIDSSKIDEIKTL